MTAAIIDTGLKRDHVDFLPSSRYVGGRNFVGAKPEEDVSDFHGHGTHVAGVLAAGGTIHHGIAPKARLVILKIGNYNGPSRAALRDALQWVVRKRRKLNISVVNVSCADGSYVDDTSFTPNDIQPLIAKLRSKGVPVVISSGNAFFQQPCEGMGHPAIFRESTSVGAVYAADVGCHEYLDGSKAFSTGPGRFLPMSQRLHQTTHRATKTDIFAPGAHTISCGIASPTDSTTMTGTSQAAPVIAGILLLMQEYAIRNFEYRATVDELEASLVAGADLRYDGDDEDDNGRHTKKEYPIVNAVGAIEALDRILSASFVVRCLRKLGFR